MNSIDKKRYIWVIISALFQGILLGIYAIIKSGPLTCMPLTVIFLVPFVFWLSQEHWGRRLVNFLVGLTAVLLIFWIYRLWSLYSPNGSFYFVPSQKSDLIRTSMAVFLIIPFFQCRIAAWSWKFPYSEIFFQFCRNLFLLFQASIVIAVFWGLMVTAGLLFDIVGLHSVPFMIFNPLTAVPLSSLSIAISISVAIKHPGIDSLGRWLLSVLAWLLPFFSVLSVMFLLCLPYSGLKTLWSTGQASTLMLLLQFGTIILANAAWLDGAKPAFKNKYINFLAQISLLCLPIYAGLSIYSTGLRINQYGLSTDRIQALFFVIITGVCGLGYAVSTLIRKWPQNIGKVNMGTILFTIFLVSLMNSPILDPFRLTAQNQIQRLNSGKISPDDFDYTYTRFNLGRFGSKTISDLTSHPSEEVRNSAAKALEVPPEEYLNYSLTGIPPKSVRREIISNAKVYGEKSLTNEQVEFFTDELEKSDALKNVQNSDEIAFVFMNIKSSVIILFTENSGNVYKIDHEKISQIGKLSGNFNIAKFSEEVFKVSEPQYMDIEINGTSYQIVKGD